MALKARPAAEGSTQLSSSYTLITTGASLGSLLTQWSVHSSDASERDLTLALGESGSEKILLVIPVPAGSGNSSAVPPLDLFNGLIIPGENSISGRIRRLHSGVKISAKISSGTSVTLHWTRLDYAEE